MLQTACDDDPIQGKQWHNEADPQTGQDRTGHPPKEMSTEVARSLLERLGRRVAIIIIIAINHKV